MIVCDFGEDIEKREFSKEGEIVTKQNYYVYLCQDDKLPILKLINHGNSSKFWF